MKEPSSEARGTTALAVAAASFALVLTAYALGNIHKNAWTVIDDHEILSWFGARARLAAADYWQVLGMTEVLDPSRAARFRPVYYGLRVAEAIVFGKNVALWYAANWLMFAASVFLVAYAGLRYLASGWREGAVVLAGTALVASRYYWADAFGRLGPSESYAVAGAALAALGFVAVLAGGDRRRRWYWVSIAGTLAAAGSKENLLVLAVPLSFVAVKDWRTLSWTLRVAFVAALLLLVAEGAWVLRLVSASGADIYGNTTSAAERLGLLSAFLRRPEVLVTIGAGAGLGAGLVAWRARRRAPLPDAARPLVVLAAMLAGCAALAATQFVFYAGKLPSRSRYDFPYVTAFDAAIVAAAVVALRLARAARELRLPAGRGAAPERWRAGGLGPTLLAAVLSAALAVVAAGGLATTRLDVRWLRGAHHAFDARLASALAAMERSGARAVVLRAQRGIDYEPAMSVARHLVARGVPAPIYLTIEDGADALAEDGWEKGLLRDMRRWSAGGFEGIRPLPPDGAGRCFAFVFHGAPAGPCVAGVEIWPIDLEKWARGE